MLSAYVDGASQESLESQLKYTIPPTSPAVVARREATIFSSGGDSYSPQNGVRACVFRLAAGNTFLDPAGVFFSATYHNDYGAILSFKAPAFAAIQRVSARIGNTSVEDLHSFGRLFSMLHVLSDPEDQKMLAVSAGDGPNGALGATGSAIGVGASAKYGFPLSPLALTRCGKCIPIGLAGLELVMELTPNALTFASTAEEAANPPDWHLSDCQLRCTLLTLDSAVSEQVHKHTLQGRSLPLVLPGTWMCIDQLSTANGTFHLAKNCSRAEKLFITYSESGDDEVIDFARPNSSTGTVELLVGSRRYPDRALEWGDTPSFWNLLQKTVGLGQKLNITRGSYTTQSGTDRKSFIVGIPLTKSPGDGAGGEVQFTGEDLSSGSLVTVQQKGCTGPNRIWLALQYTALVEIEAGGVQLSE